MPPLIFFTFLNPISCSTTEAIADRPELAQNIDHFFIAIHELVSVTGILTVGQAPECREEHLTPLQ